MIKEFFIDIDVGEARITDACSFLPLVTIDNLFFFGDGEALFLGDFPPAAILLVCLAWVGEPGFDKF